jgi:hypothetical protein
MQQIMVERWTFLAGIVTFVAGYAVSVFYGSQFNIQSGTTIDPSPGIFLIAAVFFILSYALAGRRVPDEAVSAAAHSD